MESATVELDAQYRTIREGAGILRRASRRLISVSGAEAAEYLQGQLTNDLEALTPGEGCYAALLDRKGHMQADMRVLRIGEDELWIETEDLAAAAVLRHLSMYKVGRDAEVGGLMPERAVLSLFGPASAEVAGSGPVGPENSSREAEIGGAPVRLVATDVGLDAIVAADAVAAVEAALLAAGAEPVSEQAAEIVRVERGRPRFGAEMTSATIPAEAGIDERAISFTKGCYIGQETVARLHYRGKLNRHLRGLRLSASAAVGDAVRLGDRELGVVGTAVLSPARGPIALAILRREAGPGDKVEVGSGISATVVDLPFE